jgi:hypothetical protein
MQLHSKMNSFRGQDHVRIATNTKEDLLKQEQVMEKREKEGCDICEQEGTAFQTGRNRSGLLCESYSRQLS